MAEMTYDNNGFRFVWHGGAYIDIIRISEEFLPLSESGREERLSANPFRVIGETIDCINVWDYETDKPTIARTESAFRERCVKWLNSPV